MSSNKKIIVTGGAGYLGSVLVPILLSRGYFVTVLDRFFFGKDTLSDHFNNPNLRLIEHDTRWFPKVLLKGSFALLDLAAISNDPSGELDPQKTMDINFHARVRSATLCKELGVERYLLASSCSVYGANDNLLKEDDSTNPLTTYAKACLLAEKGALNLCDDKFSVTVLRQGTLYGLSPRMRFDILLNTMTMSLYKTGQITVRGGGQWRPVVHVRDSAMSFVKVLESKYEKVKGETFNVGDTKQNYNVSELPKKIFKALHKTPKIHEDDLTVDVRSYRVSCEKISSQLGYKVFETPESGAREVYQALVNKKVRNGIETMTTEWYKHLFSRDRGVLRKHFKAVRKL